MIVFNNGLIKFLKNLTVHFRNQHKQAPAHPCPRPRKTSDSIFPFAYLCLCILYQDATQNFVFKNGSWKWIVLKSLKPLIYLDFIIVEFVHHPHLYNLGCYQKTQVF